MRLNQSLSKDHVSVQVAISLILMDRHQASLKQLKWRKSEVRQKLVDFRSQLIFLASRNAVSEFEYFYKLGTSYIT